MLQISILFFAKIVVFVATRITESEKPMKKKEGIKISFVDSYSAMDVTGSNIFISTPTTKILLDCGLHQSNDKKDDYIINKRKTKEYKPKDLDFIFICHNHADHSLMFPKYYADGFRGACIVPNDAKTIMKDMMLDGAYINERDVEVMNKQYDKNWLPLYTEQNVIDCMDYIIEKPIGEKIVINDEISFKFIPSGHLLNGCQLILWITYNNVTKCIGYTSDIGNNLVDNYYVGELKKIDKCDLLIGESTYGNRPQLKTRKKERENDIKKLKSIIDNQVKESRGRVVIPVFAQGRCASILTMIYELYKNENFDYNVYVDSPLAIKLLNDYQEILNGDEKELIENVLNWKNLKLIKETDDSKALVSSSEPCVILSTSGFCNVGRIRHHFKSIVSNPNATILFCGYSSDGSLASMLKDPKRKSIDIDGKIYPVRCNCQCLKSMSGHATFEVLLDYYSHVNCNKIVLHHGSDESKETLSKMLMESLEKECKSTRVVCANSSLKFSI